MLTESDGDHDYFHVVSYILKRTEHLQELTDWYENVHVPGLLAVPGITAVTRYAQLGFDNRFLTVWEIESPAVLEHPKYVQARGWGRWEPDVEQWTVSLLRREGPARKFSATPGSRCSGLGGSSSR